MRGYVVKVCLIVLGLVAFGLFLASPWHPNTCGRTGQAAALRGESMADYAPKDGTRIEDRCTEQNPDTKARATRLRVYNLQPAGARAALDAAFTAADRAGWVKAGVSVTRDGTIVGTRFVKNLPTGDAELTISLAGTVDQPTLRLEMAHEFRP